MSVIERILYNGHIITLDPAQPVVSALAIVGERIVALGADEDVLALAGPGTRRENLEGHVVIPGLTDAHIHWAMTAQELQWVDVFEVPSKSIVLERVAERASSTEPGEWIRGSGWSQDFWPEPVFPTAADLDAVAPHNPVLLRAKSGHAAWVNSAALKRCGVNSNTPDPKGGQIQRDASGQPTGILFETAIDLVRSQVPDPTPEQLADQMAEAQKLALKSGLTGIHDFDGPDCLRALQILRERGGLGLRVVKNVNKEWIDALLTTGLRHGFGDDWIRIGAQKIFADGALGPRTAYMIDPYEGEPDNYGISVVDKEEMQELVSRASAAGMPSTIHAIGDRAVHDVLDVFEAARREEAERGEARTTRRHRIEHVQIIHPDDIHRLAQLDVIASMQPIHATSDYLASERSWGARSRWAYNIRLQIDQGARIALGTDSPVEPFQPMNSIYAAVTRRRPDGSPGPDGWYPELRLTMDETLRGFTAGPAYAASMENRLGKLAPGYLADLVLLDRNLYKIAPDEILDTQILGTMVGGQWRYGLLL
ncbi:MAG: amidohydrolase [Anaerolineaceae bacterium]|nr:amidohydrolase [Anaerolineaceae bacterium]